MPRPGPGKVEIVVQDHKDFQSLKMQRRKWKIPDDLEGYSPYNVVPLCIEAPQRTVQCTSQKFEIKFGLKSGSSGFIFNCLYWLIRGIKLWHRLVYSHLNNIRLMSRRTKLNLNEIILHRVFHNSKFPDFRDCRNFFPTCSSHKR